MNFNEMTLGEVSIHLDDVDTCNEFLDSAINLVICRLGDIEADADRTRRDAMYALEKIAKLNH
jgi:hypothetical protein